MSESVVGRAHAARALVGFVAALCFGPLLFPLSVESLGWIGVVTYPIRRPFWPATSAIVAALSLGLLAAGLFVRRRSAWGLAFLGGCLWTLLVIVHLGNSV